MKCVKCLELFDRIKLAKETGNPLELATCPLPPLRNCPPPPFGMASQFDKWCDDCFCNLPLNERYPKCTPKDLEQADAIINRRLYQIRDVRKKKEAAGQENGAIEQFSAKKGKGKSKKAKPNAALKAGEVPLEYNFAAERDRQLYGEDSGDSEDFIPF